MAGPFCHKKACEPAGQSEAPELIRTGSYATIHGLKSAKHLNGKKSVVVSDRMSDGRRAIVLIDDLRVDQLGHIARNPTDIDSLSGCPKKSIKDENLRVFLTLVIPMSSNL